MKKIFFLLCIILVLCGCKKKPNEEIIKNASDWFSGVEYELAKAVEKEDIEKINSICSANEELVTNTYTKHKYQVIHWAAEIAKEESLKALLENGMNPNAVDGSGETPLACIIATMAVFPPKDHKKIAEILILNGADCNFKKLYHDGENELDNEEETPFMKALYFGYDDIARMMIELGTVDINAKTKTGVTAAIHALYLRNLKNAHFIICELKADVTKPFFFNQYTMDEEIYPIDLLRKIVVSKDSKLYELKLDIIKEFLRQGISYENEPVSEDFDYMLKRK